MNVNLPPAPSSPPRSIFVWRRSKRVQDGVGGAALRRDSSSHGAQWQPEVGALALQGVEISASNICGVGWADGASHQTALRALAFKWARILFRCWKEGQPYDESRYLKALRKRGSTLLSQAEKSTAKT